MEDRVKHGVTGLFFGSFNPIHNGHLGIARYMLANGHCSKIMFIISPCNPFKVNDTLLDEKKRFELVKLAIESEQNMQASDVEFLMSKPSYTIDTLYKLSLQYPESTFKLIIGADNLRDFHLWRSWQKILAEYEILVYPRESIDISGINYPNVTVTSAPLFSLSSTQIREMVARGEDISLFVPPTLSTLIKTYYLACGKSENKKNGNTFYV